MYWKSLLIIWISSLSAFASIEYWNTQRKGANLFNRLETRDRLQAAEAKGIEFIRLVYAKWPTQSRDFLLGSADRFEKIPPKDLQRLRDVLDEANAAGLKVILTPLSLPGARWRQQNGGQDDRRLWRDFRFHQQSAEFWRQLAVALKGHPAVVGYNLLNEPHPEKASASFTSLWTADFAKWYATVQGTPADLNLLYTRIAEAIRSVDEATPIVLDCGFYSIAPAIQYLAPLKDPRVIYSFHMYEPFEYTNKISNKGRFRYPGKVTVGEENGIKIEKDWNRKELSEFLAPIRQWQTKHGVPSSRILSGEFGVNRTVPGADSYLQDLIHIFNADKWHWAFYAFREDTWPAMDYELGTRPLGEIYWKAVKEGKDLAEFRKQTALSKILFNEFKHAPDSGTPLR